MSDRPKNGQEEAHTRGDAAAIAPELAPDVLPGADPLDLLAGSPDLDAQDVLALIAEPALTARRARGRPSGAANRKNGDMVRYLAAHGHRDPWVTLSLIQSADFAHLCTLVGATTAKAKMAVLKVQAAAAAEIMPYHHGKRPAQLELLGEGSKRPLMVIGEMNVAVAGDLGIMSAGIAPGAEKPNEINGEIVRESGASRTDGLSD